MRIQYNLQRTLRIDVCWKTSPYSCLITQRIKDLSSSLSIAMVTLLVPLFVQFTSPVVTVVGSSAYVVGKKPIIRYFSQINVPGGFPTFPEQVKVTFWPSIMLPLTPVIKGDSAGFSAAAEKNNHKQFYKHYKTIIKMIIYSFLYCLILKNILIITFLSFFFYIDFILRLLIFWNTLAIALKKKKNSMSITWENGL